MIRKFLLGAMALISATAASAQSVIPEADIKLMVVSDLGRNGYYSQKKVASTMGAAAAQIGPDAVLALGDTHHFGGVQSVADPLWLTNYELIYDHPELQIDWLPVCGNHEYRGNTQAVLDYSKVSRRWVMPARYYSRVFEDNGTSVRIIFLDTTPLIGKYRKKTNTYPDAAKQDVQAQLEWLDKTLSDANEDWVVVVGHHPVYAFTDKTDSERTDMQNTVDPLLRKHNVDMYICGHIHNFQHIHTPGSAIDYVVNTSGSLTRKPLPMEGTLFCSDAPGFSVLTATPHTLSLYMIDSEGEIIHTVSRSSDSSPSH